MCSCKKYEEGPSFSLKTVKARLSGEWQIEKYTVNGIDSTELIWNDYRYCSTLGINSLTFAKKSVNYKTFYISGKYLYSYGGSGKINLINNKNYIVFTFNYLPKNTTYPTCLSEKNIEWKIIKLYDKAMSLEALIEPNKYRLDFIKKKEL